MLHYSLHRTDGLIRLMIFHLIHKYLIASTIEALHHSLAIKANWRRKCRTEWKVEFPKGHWAKTIGNILILIMIIVVVLACRQNKF